MIPITIRRIVASTMVSSALVAAAQTSESDKPVSKKLEGCVTQQKGAPGFYVISAGDMCAQLAGTFDAAKVMNHRVTFHGLLSAATPKTPSTLKVTEEGEIGDACSQTCDLVPPGHRGLHGHPTPGSEGGTVGATGNDPHPQ